MHIDHIALWTNQLEVMRKFYEQYFHAQAGNKYQNPRNQFESYFLEFPEGTRLELMSRPDIRDSRRPYAGEYTGYIHIAFSTGSESAVNSLTEQLVNDGHPLVGGPRYTGDGYYESVVLDPDGNRVEITI